MTEILQNLSEIARQFWGLWLMMLFLGVVWFAYNPAKKEKMKSYAAIPLNDDVPLQEKRGKDS